jgi:hypothetical protein
VREWPRIKNPEALEMSQTEKDWVWAVRIGGVVTAISTVAIIGSPGSLFCYLGAPGALGGALLAVLFTGNYGGHTTFIVSFAAFVNLMLDTTLGFGAIRLLRALRKMVR